MATSAKQYYLKCVQAGYDPDGTYRAVAVFTHYMIGTLSRRQWCTGPIKGLRRACLNAKAMAVVKDIISKGEETGVRFWVEPQPQEDRK